MRRLIKPIAIILCPMILMAGCATQNTAPVTSNAGISAKGLSESNRARVISRLEKVGYSKEEAVARVNKMSGDEICYFAEHPESIKRSGFIILASLIGSSVWTTMNNAKKKRAAYTLHLSNKIGQYRTEITLLDNDRKNETTLLAAEQDPAKKAERQANIKRMGDEVQSKLELIKSLENETELVRTKKQKVPKDFKAP
jgi:hypothetical protein